MKFGFTMGGLKARAKFDLNAQLHEITPENEERMLERIVRDSIPMTDAGIIKVIQSDPKVLYDRVEGSLLNLGTFGDPKRPIDLVYEILYRRVKKVLEEELAFLRRIDQIQTKEGLPPLVGS
jgi:hypothetical protein